MYNYASSCSKTKSTFLQHAKKIRVMEMTGKNIRAFIPIVNVFILKSTMWESTLSNTGIMGNDI